jgi:hypothetical protein
MKILSIVKGALFACASLALASAATVANASVLYTSGYTGQAVTIEYNGVSQSTSAIAFTGATLDGNPIPDFWCIDLSKHVPYPPWSLPGIPGYTAATFQSAPLGFSAGQVQDLRNLFATKLGSAFTDAEHTAAFQLAIWDILFDDDRNLSTFATGFGVVSIGDPNTVGLAQGWLNGLAALPASSFQLTQLTSTDHQNFIYPGTPFRVPEPADVALVGIGLVAMMFFRRRRAAVNSM